VQGVVGGVRPRPQGNGQVPVLDTELLTASTTLLQSGSGYSRLVDALQALNQDANIVSLLQAIQSQASAITTLQSQMAQTISAVQTLQQQVFTLQNQVTTLQGQLDGVSFAGNTGGVPIGGVSGNTHITLGGITYSLPLYVQSP
jgi:TolA-binding protein